MHGIARQKIRTNADLNDSGCPRTATNQVFMPIPDGVCPPRGGHTTANPLLVPRLAAGAALIRVHAHEISLGFSPGRSQHERTGFSTGSAGQGRTHTDWQRSHCCAYQTGVSSFIRTGAVPVGSLPCPADTFSVINSLWHQPGTKQPASSPEGLADPAELH